MHSAEDPIAVGSIDRDFPSDTFEERPPDRVHDPTEQGTGAEQREEDDEELSASNRPSSHKPDTKPGESKLFPKAEGTDTVNEEPPEETFNKQALQAESKTERN